MPASPCIDPGPGVCEALLTLAWQVLRTGVREHKLQLPPPPTSPALLQSAATFVTLHHRGELRGCVGSIQADKPLWQDACEHAYASAFEDLRFEPVSIGELKRLTLAISILSALETVPNQGEAALLALLTPGTDGLLLQQAERRALFLPSVWQSLPSPRAFLRALKHKGGWPQDYWDPSIEIARFRTLVLR
jgi:uncharacterized protein